MNGDDHIFNKKAATRLKKILCFALSAAVILSCLLLASCGKSGENGEAITDIRQLDGHTIGVMSGSSFDIYTDELIENADKQYYDLLPDLALAVEQGKIAGFLMDEPTARLLCMENKAVACIPGVLVQEGYAAAFSKNERGAQRSV